MNQAGRADGSIRLARRFSSLRTDVAVRVAEYAGPADRPVKDAEALQLGIGRQAVRDAHGLDAGCARPISALMRWDAAGRLPKPFLGFARPRKPRPCSCGVAARSERKPLIRRTRFALP